MQQGFRKDAEESLTTNSPVTECRTMAQNSSFLAGFYHWHQGGDIKTASSLAENQEVLFSKEGAFKEMFKEVIGKITKPEFKEDMRQKNKELNLNEFVVQEMTSLFQKNMEDLIKLNFTDSGKEHGCHSAQP